MNNGIISEGDDVYTLDMDAIDGTSRLSSILPNNSTCRPNNRENLPRDILAFNIKSQDDADKIERCSEIRGNIKVSLQSVGSVSFPGITHIYGDFVIGNTNEINVTGLSFVDGSILLQNNTGDSFQAHQLTRVENLYIIGNTYAKVSMPNLQYVSHNLTVIGNHELTILEFEQLGSIGDSGWSRSGANPIAIHQFLTINDNEKLDEIRFPYLDYLWSNNSMSGNFNILSAPNLTGISTTNIRTTSTAFDCSLSPFYEKALADKHGHWTYTDLASGYKFSCASNHGGVPDSKSFSVKGYKSKASFKPIHIIIIIVVVILVLLGGFIIWQLLDSRRKKKNQITAANAALVSVSTPDCQDAPPKYGDVLRSDELLPVYSAQSAENEVSGSAPTAISNSNPDGAISGEGNRPRE